MKIKNEAQIQRKVLKAIRDDKLYGLIVDTSGMTSDDDEEGEKKEIEGFPQFSIDHLSRKAALRAGKNVLDRLSILVPLVTDKNVSITKGEVLRPDIVCINPETESVVIFELKKERQTGREALTELFAYEQEIKNLLPFLSNYDVSFVLISAEWSPLMDHAVSAAITWSGRQVLCLSAKLSGSKLALETRVPPAWKITGSVYFPEDAMPSVTVCLYDKDAYTPGWSKDASKTSEIDTRIWTALEIIAREGERLGGHGFALLWKDHRNISLTKYNITVCGLSPFAFYKAGRERNNIGINQNEFVKQLDAYLRDYDPQGHSAALMGTATAAFPILREVSDPALEGFHTWRDDRLILRDSAEPLLCEFWGALGDYARAYVMNPAIRKLRRNLLVGGKGDWRHPSVGLPLIQSFTRPEIFSDGDVRCSDAFRLGVMLGLDRALRLTLRQSGKETSKFLCQFEWNRIELMSAVDEVRLLADAAENVNPPNEPFKFYGDPLVDDEADHNSFMNWLMSEFFQKSMPHILFFELGYNGAIAFDYVERHFFIQPLPSKYTERIEVALRDATTLVMALFRQLEEGGFWGDLQPTYKGLRRALELKGRASLQKIADLPISHLLSVWPLLLSASERIIPSVFHKHSPLVSAQIDWPWLQQGVTEMRERGIADAGVILLPNGQIVTGPVLPQGVKLNFEFGDPQKEVPFLDRSSGFGFMRIVSWNELESGVALNYGHKKSTFHPLKEGNDSTNE